MGVDFNSFRCVHYIFFPFNQETIFMFSTKFSDTFFLLKTAQKLAMIENRHKYHSFFVTIVLVS